MRRLCGLLNSTQQVSRVARWSATRGRLYSTGMHASLLPVLVRPSYRLRSAGSKPFPRTASYFRFELRTRGGASSVFQKQSTRVDPRSTRNCVNSGETSCSCRQTFPLETVPSLLSLPHSTARTGPNDSSRPITTMCESALVRARRSSAPSPSRADQHAAPRVAEPLTVRFAPARVQSTFSMTTRTRLRLLSKSRPSTSRA